MDVIAKEFHFHHTCYRQISKLSDPCNSDSETRKKCFDDLVSYIEGIFINEVVRISCISKIYENIQKDKGIAIQGTSHLLLKARLQNHFKGRIDFFRKNETSIDLIYGTSKEPIQFRRNTIEEKVKKVAAIIRNEIKDFRDPFSSWPPPSNEFLPENIEIAPLLYTLLTELLTTGTEKKGTSRLVKSIGQDILYNSSNGRIKTMKQLQLGVFTKRKTGSKLLIECLNKLGHSVLYYAVNHFEIFTAENESKNACLQNYVPKKVQPSSFVTFVYDNCDHNPKTINGEVMHCTNAMIIQRTPKQANHISICSTKPIQKRRSFEPIAKNIAPYIQPKDRKNLPVIRNIEIENNNLGDMLDFSTKFQMLNKINCMNHIQHIISQSSINLQQGHHVLCLHKFFDYTLYWCLYIKSVQKAMKNWSSCFIIYIPDSF